MFYVYEWFIVETGEVIYVGKGTRNRYKAKKKNKFLNRLLETNNCDVRIVAYYSTEAESFEAEVRRISSLKTIGQAVCNKYVFKTGGVGYIWTDERRKQMSEHNPMKRESQRERMSKHNPMKDPEVVERVTSQKRKPIFIGEKTFSCQREAAERFEVATSTVLFWLKRGTARNGLKCGYVDITEENKQIAISKQELPDESIIYDGTEFESAIKVAEYVNKDKRTVIRWCKKGFSTDGTPCRFKGDKTEYIYQKPNKAHGMIPVTINGIYYESERAACDALKCDYRKLYQLIKGQYGQANQQPSCGKSDNSTTEGSTTNG